MNTECVTKYRAGIALAGILLLSAFLNIWNLWNQGYSNSYYAAAVRSMLANPAAAFFSSFDAAGFITVDKPPVGLWIQAVFAAVLGYNNWVLDLPQALAGVASVALIFFIVSRPFGKPAGLIAAFALAITPIFVATARNQTMDLQLIFVILLAVWAALAAARTKSFWFLAAAAVLVGIGFNIKMIQAFIVVPAILAVYFFGASIPLRKKALHLVAAILILLIVSLSWAVVVDLVPADQRPYIGSSGDNTVFGLILGHNGIERLESTRSMVKGSAPGSFPSIGNMTPGHGGMFTGQARPGTQGRWSATGNMTASYGNEDSLDDPAGSPEGTGLSLGTAGAGPQAAGPGNQTDQSSSRVSTGQNGWQAGAGGQPGGGMRQGTPSLFRFTESDVAGQISWLLPLALIGLLVWVRKPASLTGKGLLDAGLCKEKGLTLMAMGLWLLPGLLYFSFTSGFWHTYYLATIAPPLAALVGIGVIGMYDAWRKDRAAGWLLVAAVLITGLLEVRILLYDAGFAGLLIPGVLAGTIIVTALLVWLRKTGRHSGQVPVAVLLIALAVLFIAPLAWACTPMGYRGGDNLPTAGPQAGTVSGDGRMQGGISGVSAGMNAPPMQAGGMPAAGTGTGQSGNAGGPPGMGNISAQGSAGQQPGTSGGTGAGGMASLPGGGGMRSRDDSPTEELAAYLITHNNRETFLAATTGTHAAAGLIIATGKPVMALGGFLGTDQPLTLDEFIDEVRNGTVRYFLASGGGGGMGGAGGSSAIMSWVESSCAEVTDLNGTESDSTVLLYDCSDAV